MNQADNPAWIEQLAERHGRMVFGAAWRVLGRVEDAEDVLQDVFLKLLKSGPRENEVAEWGAYLRVMATRAAIDLLRKRRAAPLGPDELGEIPDESGVSPRESAARREQLQLLRQGMASLPRGDAELFALRHFEELSYEELAGRFGMTVSRIGVRLHRARKRLIELLAPLLTPAAVKEKKHERSAR